LYPPRAIDPAALSSGDVIAAWSRRPRRAPAAAIGPDREACPAASTLAALLRSAGDRRRLSQSVSSLAIDYAPKALLSTP